MRLLLFLILLSTSCLAQYTSLEGHFYKMFKIDSLIQGNWKLIETHANGKIIKEPAASSWMKITKDSLFQFKPGPKRVSTLPPNEFNYELTIDPEVKDFKLDIFQKEQKEVIRYNRFDFWFRNFDELIISSDTRVDDGIGITPVKIVYVFKRSGANRLSETLARKEWFYCPEENEQFLKLKSNQRFTFYSDTLQKTNCTGSQKCLNFKKESLYQTEWSLEKPVKSNLFTNFFGSDAKVFWDVNTQKIYFFSGSAILVYTIEELDYEKLVLKQDNGSSIRIN